MGEKANGKDILEDLQRIEREIFDVQKKLPRQENPWAYMGSGSFPSA